MSNLSRKQIIILAVVLAAGCFLRLSLSLRARQDLTPFDERDWLNRGLIFYRDHNTAAWRPPLNTILIGFSMGISNFDYRFTRLIYGILSCAVLPLLFLLSRRFTGFNTSILILILGAFWPEFYSHSVLVMSEGPGIVTITGAILLTTLALQKSREGLKLAKSTLWLFFAAGLAWGLAALTREVMFFAALSLVIPVWMIFRDKAKTLVCCCVFFLGLFLCILPNTLFNYRNHKTLILITNNGPYNLWKCWGKSSIAEIDKEFWSWQVSERQRRSMKKAMQALKSDPAHVIKIISGNLNRFLDPDVYMMELFYYRFVGRGSPRTPLFLANLTAILLIPVIMGFLLFFLQERKKGEAFFLGLIIVITLFLHSMTYIQGRYRTPLTPFIIMGAVIGWKTTLSNFPSRRKIFIISLAATILIYLLSFQAIRKRVLKEHNFHLNFRQEALKTNRLHQALITHYKHSISRYSQRIRKLETLKTIPILPEYGAGK